MSTYTVPLGVEALAALRIDELALWMLVLVLCLGEFGRRGRSPQPAARVGVPAEFNDSAAASRVHVGRR